MENTLVAPVAQVHREEPEILTDVQIEQLLQEAEHRLRHQAGLATHTDDGTIDLTPVTTAPANRVRLSKLEHNLNPTAYIKDHNGVAKTNANLMVPTEQRRMADGLRSIKTQQTGKKIVSSPPILVSNLYQNEEILSQIYLDADQHLILRMPCYHESFSYHSYSDSSIT